MGILQAGSSRLQQFANTPNVIGNSSGHSRSHAERFVNAAKVVKREPAGDRSPVVLEFLGGRIRQPGKPACTHTDTEVLALHNRSANARGIRLTHDWDNLN